MSYIGNSARAERTITLDKSLQDVMSIVEKSLTYFTAVDKEINPVLKTVTFARSKGFTVGKYSIELTELPEEKLVCTYPVLEVIMEEKVMLF